MKSMLAFSRVVDDVNTVFGRVAEWLVLLAAVISAGNAAVRYALSWSSNGWLEVQWYLFAGVVMLGAAYTLNRNGHVRVDLIYGNLSDRGRLWVDVIGIVLFLFPAMLLLLWMTWPFFADSWTRWEGSQNAGGLLRWPVKILLPLGFLLVAFQGASELIKRIALLRGLAPGAEVTLAYEKPMQ